MPVVELLESRRLLSGFSAHVNFAPAGSPAVAGYVTDSGSTFGDRGNGLSYGWVGKGSQVLEHHARAPHDGPDARYDTFAVLRAKGRGTMWALAVPNGTYQLHVVAGDPRAFGVKYAIAVNGTLVVNGRATANSRWVEGTQTITVTGGSLLVTAGPKTATDKLDYLDAVQMVSPSPDPSPGPTPTPTPTPTPSDWSKPLVWTTGHAAPLALAEAQSATVNGKLYVFGGYNITTPDYQATTAAEVYDPAANTWASIAPVPQQLTHMGVASDGTYIYVAGGYVYDPKTTYQTFGTANVWRYDIAHNTWSAFVSLPAPRAAGALVLLGRELHFFDGVDPARVGHTDHWVLNLDAGNPQWVSSTSLPFSRNHMTGAVLDGKIYAIGGQPGTNDSNPSADVISWDPSNPTQWTAVASLPAARSHAVTAVYGGRIIVAGGTMAGDSPINSVISYDPATNTWSSLTPLPGPRLAPTGGVVGNQLIVTTGYDQTLRSETFLATLP